MYLFRDVHWKESNFSAHLRHVTKLIDLRVNSGTVESVSGDFCGIDLGSAILWGCIFFNCMAQDNSNGGAQLLSETRSKIINMYHVGNSLGHKLARDLKE